jgi:hypothetical protein
MFNYQLHWLMCVRSCLLFVPGLMPTGLLEGLIQSIGIRRPARSEAPRHFVGLGSNTTNGLTQLHHHPRFVDARTKPRTQDLFRCLSLFCMILGKIWFYSAETGPDLVTNTICYINRHSKTFHEVPGKKLHSSRHLSRSCLIPLSYGDSLSGQVNICSDLA